jgi:hypothetical protein
VQHLAGVGVTQFLDLGSGIPTRGNVHEVVHGVNPGGRVVYVDSEPVAVAHAQLLLSGVANVAAVGADLRDPVGVLSHPDVRGLIDFGEPVAVLMFAVLHFVPDSDDPAGVVAAYRDATTAGSYLAVSHATGEHGPAGLAEAVQAYEGSQNPGVLRGHAQVRALFDGYEVLWPGVVPTGEWRPDHLPAPGVGEPRVYAGVGRRC